MAIGKGVFRFDDRLNFGKIVDELSEFWYTVSYVPKRDYIVACAPKKYATRFSKYRLLEPIKIHGGLAFAKIIWR
jgi:hypothetical protein